MMRSGSKWYLWSKRNCYKMIVWVEKLLQRGEWEEVTEGYQYPIIGSSNYIIFEELR